MSASHGFTEYGQRIADGRLECIGVQTQFAGAKNPFPWMSETMDLGKEKNFFETRVTEYSQQRTSAGTNPGAQASRLHAA